MQLRTGTDHLTKPATCFALVHMQGQLLAEHHFTPMFFL